jgi:hypothetical protein
LMIQGCLIFDQVRASQMLVEREQ